MIGNSWYMEKMKKNLLIFDLDGTIADTIDTIRDAVNMCMEHFGFPTLDTQTVRRNVGNGVRVLIEGCAPEDLKKDSDRFCEVLDYFRECYKITHDRIDGCYGGLEDVIYELHRRGYTLAVLSNKPDALVKSIIKKLFPSGIFEIAQGQTELPRKPDPTVPRMIADELGFGVDETFYIGDSEVDVLTAKNAGMHSVAVSWGFRSREVLVESAPERIIDVPAGLLEIFE